MNGKTTKTNTVTWLHLSDLHLCSPKTGWEADGILDALKKDFKTLNKDYGLTPDLIFFTGDAAYGHLGEEKGKAIKDQYKEAADFFDDVRRSFTPEVPKENVFIVPGNHDVKRSKDREYLRKGFDGDIPKDYGLAEKWLSELLQKKGDEWKAFIKGLADYREFLEENEYSHLLQDLERLIYGTRNEVNGLIVGIAGFNSVWSSYQNDENGKLLLGGHWQIETLNKRMKGANVKIALMHHPFNWFNPAETSKVEIKMGNHFDFFLHGHEHLGWVEEVVDGYVRISAGAGYGETESEMGYNMVRLDFSTGEGRIWFRKYDSLGGGWGARSIHGKTGDDGIREIRDLRQRLKLQITPKPTKSITPPPINKKDKPDDKKIVKVQKDTFEKDSPESRGVYGRGEEIETISKSLDKHRVLTIEGMPGIGKSVLIDEVRKNHRHKDKGYVRFVLDRNTALEELYRQLARTLGCPDENPKANFSILGPLDFSVLKKYEKHCSPAIIHLESAQYLFKKDGFQNDDIKKFLFAIIDIYPGISIILESRELPPKDIFPRGIHHYQRIRGISSGSMKSYFCYPFKDRSKEGWQLNRKEEDFIFRWLGGKHEGRGAHPFAMKLLASVADGLDKTPAAILEGYEQQKKLYEELEDLLFHDLYDEVLTSTERHMLRLCAKYRERVPDLHVSKLTDIVGDKDAFAVLQRRFLLSADEGEHWYSLHSIISALTQNRFDRKSTEFFSDHEAIADAWLAQLKISSHLSLPNINATCEACYHLTEGESYNRLQELSLELLRKNVVPHLDWVSRQLSQRNKHFENRHVLELLVEIEPNEPKYHRFLAQTIEKLQGSGVDKALKHYKKAFELAPTFPAHLTDYAKCLLAQKKMKEVISLVQGLNNAIYQAVMDNHNIAVYANCLEQAGRGNDASALRREQIDKGSKHPSFYNDEANYLLNKGDYVEALDILEKAQERNCATDYTIAIKAAVLEKKGEPGKASTLRREQIDKGVRDAAFYADEANNLLKKGDYDQALYILEKAEKRNCADNHTISIKALVWEKKGEPEKASALRWEQIDKEARNPAFYADEAMYLFKQKKYPEARAMLEKAETLGCANEYTRDIKAKLPPE